MTAKIISIEELRKRAQAREGKGSVDVSSAADLPSDGSTNLPEFGDTSRAEGRAVSAEVNFPSPETEQDPSAVTGSTTPEVRFEKIIEAKKKIEANFYRGDRVGMDILRSIFGEETPEDDADTRSSQTGDSEGDRNDPNGS